jgi:hypothetical protein
VVRLCREDDGIVEQDEKKLHSIAAKKRVYGLLIFTRSSISPASRRLFIPAR